MGTEKVRLVNVVRIVRRPAHVVGRDQKVVEIHLRRHHGAAVVREMEYPAVAFVEVTLDDAFDCIQRMASLQMKVAPDSCL